MNRETLKLQLRKDLDLIMEKLPEILRDVLPNHDIWEGRDFELVFRSSMRTAKCQREKGEIHFGTDNEKLENPKIARKTLVHESIHAFGVDHNVKMRLLNFYSDLFRDVFTEKIMEKLGWEPPGEEEVEEYVDSMKRGDCNYIVFCPECGNKWFRKKKSKLVKHHDRYLCGDCEVYLKSRKLTDD